MELLPLTSVIFSLLAGSPDVDGPTSGAKEDITSRYTGRHVEEHVEDESVHKCNEAEEGVS